MSSEHSEADWRKSTRCGNSGACVEVAVLPDSIGVRDGKIGTDGPILRFRAEQWRQFIRLAQGRGQGS